MSVYAAPLNDMLYAMKEVGGLDAVVSRGREDLTSDLIEAILSEANKFAAGVLDPINRVGDTQGARWAVGGNVTTADGFSQAYAAFCDAGWNGMPARSEWGGQGMPTLVCTAVLEMWKSANMAFSLCQMLTLGAVEALARHASPALQQRFLPKMVSGQWTGTMNLTEPQAGSDLAAVRTKAVPAGEHYRLSGTKIFITWGEHDLAENIVHLVLARLPEAPEGVKGISLFICPKFLVSDDGSLGARNDLVCSSLEHKLGIHASPTAVMSFGDGPGAVGYLVGEPHQGLACMFTMMNHARLNVGLEGVAISERAYQHARSYALERVQGRTMIAGARTIIGHPDVRRMLMDMKARTDAMRALAYYTAGQMDRAIGHEDARQRALSQSRVDVLTPVVKGWCTECAQEVTANGMQIHGGMGYIEETGAAQYLRDARITTIYEGTTGIQANDLVWRKLCRDGGVAMQALLDEVQADAQRLSDHGDALLQDLGRGLREGVRALSDATSALLELHSEQPAAVAAGAVPYLELTGSVMGGWLLARMADAAVTQLASAAEGDKEFLQAKCMTAEHYMVHVLSVASGLRTIVVNGARSTLAVREQQFLF